MQTTKDYFLKNTESSMCLDIDFLIINLPTMKTLGTKIPCAF